MTKDEVKKAISEAVSQVLGSDPGYALWEKIAERAIASLFPSTLQQIEARYTHGTTTRDDTDKLLRLARYVQEQRRHTIGSEVFRSNIQFQFDALFPEAE